MAPRCRSSSWQRHNQSGNPLIDSSQKLFKRNQPPLSKKSRFRYNLVNENLNDGGKFMRWSIVVFLFLAITSNAPLALSQSFSTDKSPSHDFGIADSPFCRDIPEDVKTDCAEVYGIYQRVLKQFANDFNADKSPYCKKNQIPEAVKPHCAKVLYGTYKRALEELANVGPTDEEKKDAAKKLVAHNNWVDILTWMDREPFEPSFVYGVNTYMTSAQRMPKKLRAGENRWLSVSAQAMTGKALPVLLDYFKRYVVPILLRIIEKELKDLGDYLTKDGAEGLLEKLRRAKEIGLRGVKCVEEYRSCSYEYNVCFTILVACAEDIFFIDQL